MNLPDRKHWSSNHKLLTGILSKPNEHSRAVALFLEQHAQLYDHRMSECEALTFEDELMADLSEESFRSYPVYTPGTRNSIAWHLWHCARIEDITMNLLASDNVQVLHTEDYAQRMGTSSYLHSGNGMTEEEITGLSLSANIEGLREYRQAVGRRTRDIIQSLEPEQFAAKVSPVRIGRLREEEAVKETEQWLIDYWGRKTIAGLILMPATRHNFVHLNKSIRIKQKLQGKRLSAVSSSSE
ncbi:DinB family protein [Paenibacillus donghaensis]|uniref:DinB-like domain-containing protein n=1 Tax=Paenibacillus donghaensis TaxID=414771 RepID=A0A2Z2KYG1_9BACL|nr:DinB family protein [Paenibacillus donghaensis]ASA25558.1 hypothetical protein B9T62_35405 [Paenibacillus donghaensis]